MLQNIFDISSFSAFSSSFSGDYSVHESVDERSIDWKFWFSFEIFTVRFVKFIINFQIVLQDVGHYMFILLFRGDWWVD